MSYQPHTPAVLIPVTGILMIGDIIHYSERHYIRRRFKPAPELRGERHIIAAVDWFDSLQCDFVLLVKGCRATGLATEIPADTYIERKRQTIEAGSPKREAWEDEALRVMAVKRHLDSLTPPPRPQSPRR